MNKETACQILNITEPYTLKEVKRAFRLLALKHHPDKNKSQNSEHFIKIHEAYTFLSNDTINYSYNDLLSQFLDSINKKDSIIIQLIEQLSSYQKTYSILTFKQLDFNTAYNIFIILFRYRDIFKFSEEILSEFREILEEKSKDCNCYIIKPSLEDLYISNCYKLLHCDKEYYVPLWHNEIHYQDQNNKPIIVKCIPDIENHITIDEMNHLHVSISKNLSEILDKKSFSITLYKTPLIIHLHSLYIRHHQIITFEKEGIPMINMSEHYDNSKMSNIYIYLSLKF